MPVRSLAPDHAGTARARGADRGSRAGRRHHDGRVVPARHPRGNGTGRAPAWGRRGAGLRRARVHADRSYDQRRCGSARTGAGSAGDTIAVVRGPARGLLTAERDGLNFLGHLSGVASGTARIADAIRDHKARSPARARPCRDCARAEIRGPRRRRSNHRFGSTMQCSSRTTSRHRRRDRAGYLSRACGGRIWSRSSWRSIRSCSSVKRWPRRRCGAGLENMDLATSVKRSRWSEAARSESVRPHRRDDRAGYRFQGVDLISVGWGGRTARRCWTRLGMTGSLRLTADGSEPIPGAELRTTRPSALVPAREPARG